MISEFLEDCPDCQNERAIRKHDAVIRRKARADLLQQVRGEIESITDLQPAAASMKRRVLAAIDKLRDKEKG